MTRDLLYYLAHAWLEEGIVEPKVSHKLRCDNRTRAQSDLYPSCLAGSQRRRGRAGHRRWVTSTSNRPGLPGTSRTANASISSLSPLVATAMSLTNGTGVGERNFSRSAWS